MILRSQDNIFKFRYYFVWQFVDFWPSYKLGKYYSIFFFKNTNYIANVFEVDKTFADLFADKTSSMPWEMDVIGLTQYPVVEVI